MPKFLLGHLRALTLGPTQAHILGEWLDTPEAGEALVAALRAVLEPSDGPLKVRDCCPANMNTRGVHHDGYCAGPVPVEK